MTMAETRPSSWPVPRERQRIAEVANSQKIATILDGIDARLASIEERLGPPGLASGWPTVLERLEFLGSQVQEMREVAAFEHRLQRPETLTVCGPSSDTVLDGMFKRVQSKQTTLASNFSRGGGLGRASVCSPISLSKWETCLP